jgi:hypothetical protein
MLSAILESAARPLFINKRQPQVVYTKGAIRRAKAAKEVRDMWEVRFAKRQVYLIALQLAHRRRRRGKAMCKKRERWKHEEVIEKFVRFCAWEATEHPPVCSGYYLLLVLAAGPASGGLTTWGLARMTQQCPQSSLSGTASHLDLGHSCYP